MFSVEKLQNKLFNKKYYQILKILDLFIQNIIINSTLQPTFIFLEKQYIICIFRNTFLVCITNF